MVITQEIGHGFHQNDERACYFICILLTFGALD